MRVGEAEPEARRFLEENTGPQNPRKERNAVVLAAPSREGLSTARELIRDYSRGRACARR